MGTLFHIFREAFPDLHITAEQRMADGDFGAILFTVSGTQNGLFIDAPPSGKHFEVSGIDFVRFEQRKAAEHWGYQHDLGMMEQLGMMPQQEQPARARRGDYRQRASRE